MTPEKLSKIVAARMLGDELGGQTLSFLSLGISTPIDIIRSEKEIGGGILMWISEKEHDNLIPMGAGYIVGPSYVYQIQGVSREGHPSDPDREVRLSTVIVNFEI